MAAGYNFNQCTWLVASGPSAVELVVIDWLKGWLGYPESAGGLLTSGGSAASVDAFVAAREAAGNPERATVYMSDQSHSAHIRAARITGIRPECVRLLPTDERFRLDVDALARAVAEDRAAGFNPITVCANAGAASTGAIDPLEAMADYCEAEGIWLHADAAYGGFAVLTEKGKELLRGIEHADSVNLDGHKWFFQPYEVGGLLVKDASTLEKAFEVHHDVLQDTIWGANHPNFSDPGLQLSRSARALKIWMSVQTFGMVAFREAVSKGMALAARADEYTRESHQRKDGERVKKVGAQPTDMNQLLSRRLEYRYCSSRSGHSQEARVRRSPALGTRRAWWRLADRGSERPYAPDQCGRSTGTSRPEDMAEAIPFLSSDI